MELFNNILWWMNIIFIILIGSTFLFQFVFMFLFYVKPRQYPKANTYKDFTIVIRARNEEDVIADSVLSALNADYPEEKKHVIVFCHNCTDKTAEIVRSLKARAIEIFDDNPKHKKLSYSMKLGMEQLKKENYQTDYFLFLDADNQIDKDYILACNDAACSGVKFGRTFENSKNLTDNIISCMNGLWYIRDNRFACRARSKLHIGCVMDGPSSMVKSEYAFSWDALGASEDLEFTLNRLLYDGEIVEYIDKAMVYEDQPSTLKDMFNRNTRMGHGLNKLFWDKGVKCFKKFFQTLFKKEVPFSLKMSYLDQYFNLAIIPSSFFAAVWFSCYYIYSLIYTGFGNSIYIYGLNASYDFHWFLLFVIIVGSCCFLLPFFFQPLIAFLTERKRLVIKRKWIPFVSILLYPCYILIDALAIFVGIITKPKWKKINRSKTKIDQ